MCYLRDRINSKIGNIEYDKRVIGEIVSTMKSSFNIFKRFNLLPIEVIEKEIEEKYFSDLELLWDFGLYEILSKIPNQNTRWRWDNMRGDLMYGFRQMVKNSIGEYEEEISITMANFYNIPMIFTNFDLRSCYKYQVAVNNRVLPKQLQEEIKLEFKTDIQNKLDKREEELETYQEDLEILDIFKSYELFPQYQTDYINDKIITQLKQTPYYNGKFRTTTFSLSAEDNYREQNSNIKFCNKIIKLKDSENKNCQFKICMVNQPTYCDGFCGEYFYYGEIDKFYIKKIYDAFGIYKNFEFTNIPPPYEKYASIMNRY